MEIKVLASGSSGNCYRVSDGKTSLLLDAGIPLKAIQIGCQFRVAEINGCFISHSHQDHCKAAKDLARFGIDIYTSQGTIDACGLTGHRVHAIKVLKELIVGTFKALPFDVEHDAPDPLGFLLTSMETGEKLLYFTDTYYLKYRFNGLTHIMAECNYDKETLQQSVAAGYVPVEMVKRLVKSHMSLEHLLDMLRANGMQKVKQIYLLHLSNNNSNEAKFKKEVQKLTGTEVYVC